MMVVDINAAIVRDLQARGIPSTYGDAGRWTALEQAGLTHARTIVVTVPDLVTASAVIGTAKGVNPSAHVIARAGGHGKVLTLRADAASGVMQPEFEACLECSRYVLRRLGASSRVRELGTVRRRSRSCERVDDEQVYGVALG